MKALLFVARIVSLLLLAQAALAQQELYFAHLTEAEGLTDNRITCFLQDRRGYLWIGTYRGLSRYDGYSFQNITGRQGDTTSLPDNHIWQIAEDRQGRIWMATDKGGAARYDPVTKRFLFLRHSAAEQSLRSDAVKSVFVDKAQRLWIGYWGHGWTCYLPQSGQYVHYKSPLKILNAYGQDMANVVQDFAEGENGVIWIVTAQGICGLNTQTGRIQSWLDSNHSNSAVADNLFIALHKESDTALWVGTWGAGLKRFSTRSVTFTQHLYHSIDPVHSVYNIVTGIAPRGKDRLWISTADKGLGSFHIPTGTFTFYPHDPASRSSPLPRECRQVFTDREGGLWAGFDFGISHCVNVNAPFRHIPIPGKVAGYTANAAAWYHDEEKGKLYIGATCGLGLYIRNNASGEIKTVSYTESQPGDRCPSFVSSILRYNHDTLLVLSSFGLHVYDERRGLLTRLPLRDHEGRLLASGYRLMKDTRGNYWYSSLGNGFYRLSASLQSAVHFHSGPASPVRLTRDHADLLLIEGDSVAWINALQDGLYRFYPARNLLERVSFSLPPAKDADFKQMLPDKSGGWWICGFNTGLGRILKESSGRYSYHTLDAENGIMSEEAQAMVLDAKERLWLATTKGLAVQTGPTQFKTFGEKDGYRWAQFMSSIAIDGGGRLYANAESGYITFHSDSVTPQWVPPRVLLQSLRILDKPWSDTADLAALKEIHLAYDHNFLSADYAAISFSNPAAIRYSYMLEGLDKQWVNAGTRRFLSYPGLPPGKYTLRIRAAIDGGQWGSEGVAVKVVIHPPFWRTWWFYALMILAAGSIIYSIYRYRLQEVRREARLKSEFNRKIAESEMKALRAQMNPHFIFNSLNAINRYIVKSDAETASNYLTKFSKLIRLILDSSAASTTTLEQEIQLLKLYIEMEALRFKDKFSYEITTDESLNAETTSLPSMIVQPYIENAIWHGLLHKESKGSLRISFRKRLGLLEIVIEDNGIGRQKAQELKSRDALKKKSYGMKISGDRISIANQVYGIQTTVLIEDLYAEGEASGTRVTLNIPIEEVKP